MKKRSDVVVAALGFAALSVGCVLIHVEVNYQPELRAIVRPRATIVTGVVSFLFASVMFYQFRKINVLVRELQRLVDRDRLTDVATRDYFFAKMEQTQPSFGTVLMVDIDHFKRINDSFGHLAGDQVIQDVAHTLQEHVRYSDVVCRFGGEEFLVFLFSMTTVDGHAVAERMRAAIAQQRTYLDGAEIRATVSIGGALKEPLEEADLAIQKADQALYRAKGAGRNRVMFETGVPMVMVGHA